MLLCEPPLAYQAAMLVAVVLFFALKYWEK